MFCLFKLKPNNVDSLYDPSTLFICSKIMSTMLRDGHIISFIIA